MIGRGDASSHPGARWASQPVCTAAARVMPSLSGPMPFSRSTVVAAAADADTDDREQHERGQPDPQRTCHASTYARSAGLLRERI